MAVFVPIGRDSGQKASSNTELTTSLEGALDSLPQCCRVVFVLREIEGMNPAETAEALELTEDTVSARLHQARTLLAEKLSESASIRTICVFELPLSGGDRIVKKVLERIAALRSRPQ